MTRFSSGARHLHYPSLASTARHAKQAVEANALPGMPFWITCDVQTDGYGRRGRAWSQAMGDFAGNFVFQPTAPTARLPEYSFIASLSVRDAIASLLASQHSDAINAKWPNDILVYGKKVAGILLEMIMPPGKPPIISIGIGVNVISAPDKLPYPTTCLDDFGARPTITELATSIDHHFQNWQQIWLDHGFGTIRDAWCEVASGIGKPIQINLQHESISGRFKGIDDQGRIIVETGGEDRSISSGDVFFPSIE